MPRCHPYIHTYFNSSTHHSIHPSLHPSVHTLFVNSVLSCHVISLDCALLGAPFVRGRGGYGRGPQEGEDRILPQCLVQGFLQLVPWRWQIKQWAWDADRYHPFSCANLPCHAHAQFREWMVWLWSWEGRPHWLGPRWTSGSFKGCWAGCGVICELCWWEIYRNLLLCLTLIVLCCVFYMSFIYISISISIK